VIHTKEARVVETVTCVDHTASRVIIGWLLAWTVRFVLLRTHLVWLNYTTYSIQELSAVDLLSIIVLMVAAHRCPRCLGSNI
jgi:hypothetical protein